MNIEAMVGKEVGIQQRCKFYLLTTIYNYKITGGGSPNITSCRQLFQRERRTCFDTFHPFPQLLYLERIDGYCTG